MDITVKGKKYESGKMHRKKYSDFIKVRNKLNEKEIFDDSDLDDMVSAIVKVFDNKFTEDDVNEDMEVSDIIFNFSAIDFEVATKVNKKVEKVTKDFTKGKK